MKLIKTLVEITSQGVRDRIHPEGEMYEDFMKVLMLWNRSGKINFDILDMIGEDYTYQNFYRIEYWRHFGIKKLKELNDDIKGTIVEIKDKEVFFHFDIRFKVNGFELKEYDNFLDNDLMLSFDILEGSFVQIPKLFDDDKLDLIKVIGRGDREFNDKYSELMLGSTYEILMTRLKRQIMEKYVEPFELELLTGIYPRVLILPSHYSERSKGN